MTEGHLLYTDTMKILSWNIYKNNQTLDAATAFLAGTACDVVCLQEVPAAELIRFASLMPYMEVADERMVFKGSGRVDHLKLVILSRFPIVGTGKEAHAPLTKPSHRYETFHLEYQWVDVMVEEEVIRVYNTHFMCVTGPARRLSQLQEVLESLGVPERSIICGDFNTLGTVVFSLVLARVFRFSFQEVFINERKEIEQAVAARGLVNVFRRYRTFFPVPLQLDYILVPKTLSVEAKDRYKERYGSDHFPISVTVAVS